MATYTKSDLIIADKIFNIYKDMLLANIELKLDLSTVNIDSFRWHIRKSLRKSGYDFALSFTDKFGESYAIDISVDKIELELMGHD